MVRPAQLVPQDPRRLAAQTVAAEGVEDHEPVVRIGDVRREDAQRDEPLAAGRRGAHQRGHLVRAEVVEPHRVLEHALPPAHAGFVYVFDGALLVGDKGETVRRGELAVLGPGKRVALAAGSEPGRAILVAGKPLREPIAKYGPFVMNTEMEIVQAIRDYQAGKF